MSNADMVRHLGLDLQRYMDAEGSVDAMEEIALLRLRRLVEREGIDLSLSFIAHSGRKDSTALAALVERAFPNQRILYVHIPNHETDPQTIWYMYSLDRIVLNVPDDGKLGTLYDAFKAQFVGHRWEDGHERGLFDTNVAPIPIICPIFDWSEEEVWAYILTRKLSFSNIYSPNEADSHGHSDHCPACRR